MFFLLLRTLPEFLSTEFGFFFCHAQKMVKEMVFISGIAYYTTYNSEYNRETRLLLYKKTKSQQSIYRFLAFTFLYIHFLSYMLYPLLMPLTLLNHVKVTKERSGKSSKRILYFDINIPLQNIKRLKRNLESNNNNKNNVQKKKK